jgi:hypothetical protein
MRLKKLFPTRILKRVNRVTEHQSSEINPTRLSALAEGSNRAALEYPIQNTEVRSTPLTPCRTAEFFNLERGSRNRTALPRVEPWCITMMLPPPRLKWVARCPLVGGAALRV